MVRAHIAPFTLALAIAAGAVAAIDRTTPMYVGVAAAQPAIDERPASELTDEELTARFRALQALVRDRSVDDELRKRLRAMMRDDRQELQRRKADAAAGRREPEERSGEQQAPEQPARTQPQEQPAPEQPAQTQPQEQPAQSRQQEQPAQTQPQEQPTVEQRARRKREESQSGEQPAPEPPAQTQSQEQPAPEQPAETQSQEEPAAEQRAKRKRDDQQRRQRKDDQDDRQQARPQPTPTAPAAEQSAGRSGDGDLRAEKLLRDRRRAKQLKDDPLRQRLEAIRELLGTGSVSDRTARALRELLHGDREELRERVSRRRDDGRQGDDRARYGGDDRDGGDRRDLIRLLRDDRPSSTLSDAALTARSEAARDALARGKVSPDQADRLRTLLASDRRELRSRLRAQREDRRRDLRRKGQSAGLRIEIRPNVRPAPRRSIAAAEADEAALERQLAAPPTLRIERRYSFDEYARRPELREVMPGIELDTINFGFNEYTVREEEIDELDRIGGIMERILAANPDEVFVVEGHTDAVGSDAYNYDLSVKRARAVRDALLEYFVIEPGSIETIGYGERYLKIPTEFEEAENRRVTVRRITPILEGRR